MTLYVRGGPAEHLRKCEASSQLRVRLAQVVLIHLGGSSSCRGRTRGRSGRERWRWCAFTWLGCSSYSGLATGSSTSWTPRAARRSRSPSLAALA
jgi:hypothetical protein